MASRRTAQVSHPAFNFFYAILTKKNLRNHKESLVGKVSKSNLDFSQNLQVCLYFKASANSQVFGAGSVKCPAPFRSYGGVCL